MKGRWGILGRSRRRNAYTRTTIGKVRRRTSENLSIPVTFVKLRRHHHRNSSARTTHSLFRLNLGNGFPWIFSSTYLPRCTTIKSTTISSLSSACFRNKYTSYPRQQQSRQKESLNCILIKFIGCMDCRSL